MRAVLLLSAASLKAAGPAPETAPDLVLLQLREQAGGEPAPAVEQVRARWPGSPVFGRIRPLASGGLEELAALMPAQLDGIWLGNASGRAQIEQLGSHLAVAEADLGLADGATRIVASIESARGGLAVPSLAEAGPRLAAICCDLAALSRDIGCEPGPAARLAEPLRAVRAGVLLAAAACGLPAIEAGAPQIPDLDAYAAEAAQARRDGFSAKLAYDPGEIAVLERLGGQPPFGRWIENFVSGVATK